MSDERLWDSIHHQYAKTDWINRPSIFVEQFIELALTNKLLLFTNEKVLELAAGHGQDSRFFVQKNFSVASTDRPGISLDYNRSKLPPGFRNYLRIKELDLSEPKPFPYRPGTFDVVYSHLGLHYFDQATTQQIIAKIAQVLRPNGLLALLVNSTSDPEYQTGVAQGREIEPGLIQQAESTKRYFTTKSLATFVTPHFTTILLDDQGETYKDQQAGVYNLIRYIGQKAA